MKHTSTALCALIVSGLLLLACEQKSGSSASKTSSIGSTAPLTSEDAADALKKAQARADQAQTEMDQAKKAVDQANSALSAGKMAKVSAAEQTTLEKAVTSAKTALEKAEAGCKDACAMRDKCKADMDAMAAKAMPKM